MLRFCLGVGVVDPHYSVILSLLGMVLYDALASLELG